MKAIVYTQHGLPADNPESLYEMEIPKPEPGPAIFSSRSVRLP